MIVKKKKKKKNWAVQLAEITSYRGKSNHGIFVTKI